MNLGFICSGSTYSFSFLKNANNLVTLQHYIKAIGKFIQKYKAFVKLSKQKDKIL
jgi:hypothetical protein